MILCVRAIQDIQELVKLCYKQESNVDNFFLFVFNDERTIVYSGLSKNPRLLGDTNSNPPL